MRAFCSRYTFHFNALRNYLRKLERRPKWQHIRFTYDILSFLWSVQPLRVTPAYTGEKHCAYFRRTHSRGSPPRMRGKGRRWSGMPIRDRITPAHAGKRMVKDPPDKESWDHPRACGEKLLARKVARRDTGSPPRMRGKGSIGPSTSSKIGITPAHAGKRIRRPVQDSGIWDHPRACGEKTWNIVGGYNELGSPPRMRGKAKDCSESRRRKRITPAHAGKSFTPYLL